MKTKQSKIDKFGSQMTMTSLSQEHVNSLIMNYIVDDMQPFSTAEQKSFIALVTGLQTGKIIRTVMSRKTVTGK